MAQIKDVFDIDETVSKYGKKILLLGGVGSGKSTWVTDVLAKKGSVLFITSRKAKVLEDTQCTCFSEVYEWYNTGNQTLITNAKLSKLVERITDDYARELDEFIALYDYIVVDEVHSIATDSAYAESCSAVLSFIEYAVKKEKIIVCMTGTPTPIIDYFKEEKWHIVNYINRCDCVQPKCVIMLQSNQTISYIQRNCDNHKIIYFANRTDTILQLCQNLLSNRIVAASEIAVAVAKSKEAEFYEKLSKQLKADAKTIIESSKHAYSSITSRKKCLPDSCKILISTSVLKEGINILNPNIIVFCENHVLSNLIQFFGRARNGNGDVYVIEDSVEHPVTQSDILYQLAVDMEAEYATTFYKAKISNPDNPFLISERYDLTKHITDNPYIYFDYIEQCYKVFHIRYYEEVRLKNNKHWKYDLFYYCLTHGICRRFFDARKQVIESLKSIANKDYHFIKDEEIALLKRLLYTAYRIKDKQWKAISQKLKDYNSPIRVKTYKGTSGEERDKTYWKVLFAEQYDKEMLEEEKKKQAKSAKILQSLLNT